jgi:hypothetical protein
MWAVQTRLLGELARNPEGSTKKLLTAADVLTKFLRDNLFMA